MRRGIRGKLHQQAGFALGTDFVAEHECGIRDIIQHFGLTHGGQVTEKPEGLVFLEGGGFVYLAFSPYYRDRDHASAEFLSILHVSFKPKDDWQGFWSWQGFCLSAPSESEAASTIRDLHQGFEELDITMGIGARGESGNPFHRGSLCIYRTSVMEPPKAQ